MDSKEELDYIQKLYSSREYEKALTEILSYLNKYGPRDNVEFIYANILYRLDTVKNKNKAREIYEKLVNSSDKKIAYFSLTKLGILEYNDCNYNDAKKYFEDSIEKAYKDDCLPYSYLARIEYEKGNYEKALIIAKKAKNQQNPYIIFNKADIYIMKKKYQKAEKLVDSIKVNRSNSDGIYLYRKKYSYKAELAKNRSCYYKAKEYYKKTLIGPKDRSYIKSLTGYLNLEISYGNYETVKLICKELETLESDKRRLAINKAKLYIAMKEYDKAKEILLPLCIDDSANGDIIKYHLARIYMFERDHKNAEECLKLVNVKNPKHLASSNFLLAIAQYRQGKYDDALETVNLLDNEYEIGDKKRLIQAIKKAKGEELEEYNGNRYTNIQLLDYSEERAISHSDRTHGNSAWFKENIDIKEVFHKVKNLISDKYLTDISFYDTYQIPYKNIGYVNNDEADLIEVVVEFDTKNIITMFPQISASILIGKKQKRESQIEKFNKKYKKFEKCKQL